MRLLGRRDFLASMGLGPGAYLLGSIFKSNLLPAAMGAAPRKRFILISGGQAFLERQYTCDHRSETDFDLTPALQPLAAYKKDLVLASKFYNPIDIDQHGNLGAFLTVIHGPAGDLPGGPTIDRAIAKQIGGDDAYRAIAFSPRFGNRQSDSADGLREPVVALDGPARAFDKLFGLGTPEQIQITKRTAILDFISKDIAKMNARLGGPERAKLDQYLTSIQGLEHQIRTLAKPSACQLPAAPPASLRVGGAIRPDEVDAMIEMVFHAQLCGLTHVTAAWLPTGGNPQLDFLRTPEEKNQSLKDADGLDTLMNPHEMQHRGDNDRNTRVDQWSMGRIALLLERLSRTNDPGGGGTMLDNSLLVFMAYCGGIHHGGHETYSVLMAGRAGGAIKTGRYLEYPIGQHCISDVFTSWGNAMGAKMDKFGDPSVCHGPVPGLLG